MKVSQERISGSSTAAMPYSGASLPPRRRPSSPLQVDPIADSSEPLSNAEGNANTHINSNMLPAQYTEQHDGVAVSQNYPLNSGNSNYDEDSETANSARHSLDDRYYTEQQRSNPYKRFDQTDQREPTESLRPREGFQAARNTTNLSSPYHAVVVFLLLLMPLVIMGIVYQLFFRPQNSAMEPKQNAIGSVSPSTTNRRGNQTENMAENREKATEGQIYPSEPLDEPQTEPFSQAAERLSSVPANPASQQNQAGASPVAEHVEDIPQSSPVSRVTPTGEQVESATRRGVPNSGETYDENERLSKSKIGGIGYWIQVGAFTSLNNANKIKRQLTQNHLESVIQEGQAGTRKVYRVRVGLYTSREEAARILRQVKNIDSSFVKSIIIQIEV